MSYKQHHAIHIVFYLDAFDDIVRIIHLLGDKCFCPLSLLRYCIVHMNHNLLIHFNIQGHLGMEVIVNTAAMSIFVHAFWQTYVHFWGGLNLRVKLLAHLLILSAISNLLLSISTHCSFPPLLV